jgi:hypothetical protein
MLRVRTRQFVLQILVIFVAIPIRRNKGASLGITCIRISSDLFLPADIQRTLVLKRRSVRKLRSLLLAIERRGDILASDGGHPTITTSASSRQNSQYNPYPDTDSAQIAQCSRNSRHLAFRSMASEVERELTFNLEGGLRLNPIGTSFVSTLKFKLLGLQPLFPRSTFDFKVDG